MSTNDIREVQLGILSIYLEFEKVCLKHGLRYYLIAGSLLGAVRHKGFIPWDDDIDVGMPRKDYEIFMKHADEWLFYPLELDCREKNDAYPFRFAKIQNASTTLFPGKTPNYIGGIYIDIFPLDGLPDGKRRQRFHIWLHRRMERLLYFSLRDPFKHGKRLDSYLLLLLQKVVSPSQIYRILGRLSTKYDFEKSNYFTDHASGYGGIIEKKALGDKPAELIFENHKTYGIADWDYYLSSIYDNYMVPPPVEARVSTHPVTFCDLNLPYREYIIPKNNKSTKR